MSQRFEKFSFAIAEISRCWHKLTAQEMERYGLRGNHAVYLLALYRHPEGLSAPQLCKKCSKDKADVSRMVGVMEQKGLVRREGSATGYRSLLKLTPQGVQAAEFVQRRAELAVELVGRDLSDEQRSCFYAGLDSIVKNIQILAERGLPEQ